MGGPRVTPKARDQIVLCWLQLKENGIEPSAKEVLNYAEHKLKSEIARGMQLPGLRKVQEILQEARAANSDDSANTLLNEDWSMASLNRFKISPESIPSVVEAWKYAINTHHKFSIRQAKWAAWLARLVNGGALLWYWSRKYTILEELAIATNQPMDSFPADRSLLLGIWESEMLMITDYRKEDMAIYDGDSLTIAADGKNIEELWHGIDTCLKQFEQGIFKERDWNLDLEMKQLPPIDTIGLEPEAKLVYLRWFTYLTKGPKWAELSVEEILELITELRAWVLKEQKCLNPLPENPEEASESVFISSTPFAFSGIQPIPEDVLIKAGYSWARRFE
ncbi:hypothetical protein [Dehalococcoides mccartyi]|jgi:hypothetical protein|uniref:hypothetical protein n=1 Tax=Dehalococcoides mccartyi TaxID=61435 RepID=UPI0003C80AFA|nr:hypothetical protein [Dehalococcoides mccartyi]AHB14242.1 hypothetical protein GY50_1473 [Dehalococcoides mccartyi GY50]